ncbi:MAG: Ig-like domain-containing protein, partial [Accumulibacter sp.]|uniref:Ig-like domain-containing protein n=1 Tax=Accumulibacter sp. TaxID=2053492 RepID=UPI0033160FD1
MSTSTSLDFALQTSIIIDGVPLRFSAGSETATWVYGGSTCRIGFSPPSSLSQLGQYAYTNTAKVISEGEYVAFSNGLGTFSLVQITDSQSMAHGGLHDGVVFNETTVSISDPTVTSFSPLDGQAGIQVSADIVVRFSEAIQRGTGNIVLRSDGGAIVAAYDAATSSNITVSGNTLTINPSADLINGTGYEVEFGAGSIKDFAGNNYAGTLAYNFTTNAAPHSATSTSLDFDVQTSIVMDGIRLEFSAGSETATWVYGGSTCRIGFSPPSSLSQLGQYAYTNTAKVISEGEYVAFSDGHGAYSLIQITDSQSRAHGGLRDGVVFRESSPALATASGKVTTDFGASESGQSVTLQADGKILVAGYSDSNNYDFALVRYDANGSLDTSFDSDGKLTTDFGSLSRDVGRSVTVQADGKILVGGESDYHFAVARYNVNGSLDTDFDSDGKVTTDFGSQADGYSVTVQGDGKILVAGYAASGSGSGYDFALARYNANGSLDTSFDGDGKVTTDFGSVADLGKSATLQADGKILVAGYRNDGGVDFELARYNANGSLDTSFDSDGRVTTDFGGYDYGYSVTVQADGRILVGGFSNTSGDYFALARYNVNGSLDTGFGSNGKVMTNFGVLADVAESVTVQADGKILVAGYSAGVPNFELARYNTDGSLDTGFDGDGKVTTDFGNSSDYGYSVTVQADGKILVAGESNGDFALARYNTDGNLDTTFGNPDTSSDHEASGTLTFTGTAREGGTLAASLTNVSDADGATVTAYQWQISANLTSGWVDLGGASSANFTIAADQSQVGRWLRVVATTTDSLGGTTLFTSGGSPIANVNDAPTGGVTFSGTATQGATLTAANTLADADGMGTVYYQWLRGGAAISGATGTSYVLAASDVGQSVSVRGAYTDAFGTAESVTSTTTIVGGTPGIVFTHTANLATSEAGGTAAFEVALRDVPRHDVSVSLTISDGSEGLFQASHAATFSMTFTAANWNTPQTVTLMGVDDRLVDGDMAYVISTSVTSDDLRYDGMRSGTGLPIANLTVINADDDAPDELYGDAGGVATADLLNGGNGASDVYGKDGRDEIHGGNGDDRLYGGYGDDVLYGEADNDELEGEQGNDRLYGGDGNDTLTGGTGRDTLLGGNGNDILDGSSDADTMDGGNGADTYYADNVGDVISDSGTDGALDTVYLTAYLAGGYTLGSGIDTATLGAQANNASLTGNTGNNTLNGNASDNTLAGGEGADTLNGGDGADMLDGGVGNDILYAGSGNDSVDAGDGDDLIVGGDGAGNDHYSGGAGSDTVKYTSANASITVNLATGLAAGVDIGQDTLALIENILGGKGSDLLTGNSGANRLSGDTGNDTLDGGAGIDTMIGGDGSDTY